MAIDSSAQTTFGFPHIKGIILNAGEEVDEVAGGASGMGGDWKGEVGDRASEGQAAGEYVAVLRVDLWQGRGSGGKGLVLTRS